MCKEEFVHVKVKLLMINICDAGNTSLSVIHSYGKRNTSEHSA